MEKSVVTHNHQTNLIHRSKATRRHNDPSHDFDHLRAERENERLTLPVTTAYVVRSGSKRADTYDNLHPGDYRKATSFA